MREKQFVLFSYNTMSDQHQSFLESLKQRQADRIFQEDSEVMSETGGSFPKAPSSVASTTYSARFRTLEERWDTTAENYRIAMQLNRREASVQSREGPKDHAKKDSPKSVVTRHFDTLKADSTSAVDPPSSCAAEDWPIDDSMEVSSFIGFGPMAGPVSDDFLTAPARSTFSNVDSFQPAQIAAAISSTTKAGANATQQDEPPTTKSPNEARPENGVVDALREHQTEIQSELAKSEDHEDIAHLDAESNIDAEVAANEEHVAQTEHQSRSLESEVSVIESEVAITEVHDRQLENNDPSSESEVAINEENMAQIEHQSHSSELSGSVIESVVAFTEVHARQLEHEPSSESEVANTEENTIQIEQQPHSLESEESVTEEQAMRLETQSYAESEVANTMEDDVQLEHVSDVESEVAINEQNFVQTEHQAQTSQSEMPVIEENDMRLETQSYAESEVAIAKEDDVQLEHVSDVESEVAINEQNFAQTEQETSSKSEVLTAEEQVSLSELDNGSVSDVAKAVENAAQSKQQSESRAELAIYREDDDLAESTERNLSATQGDQSDADALPYVAEIAVKQEPIRPGNDNSKEQLGCDSEWTEASGVEEENSEPVSQPIHIPHIPDEGSSCKEEKTQKQISPLPPTRNDERFVNETYEPQEKPSEVNRVKKLARAFEARRLSKGSDSDSNRIEQLACAFGRRNPSKIHIQSNYVKNVAHAFEDGNSLSNNELSSNRVKKLAHDFEARKRSTDKVKGFHKVASAAEASRSSTDQATKVADIAYQACVLPAAKQIDEATDTSSHASTHLNAQMDHTAKVGKCSSVTSKEQIEPGANDSKIINSHICDSNEESEVRLSETEASDAGDTKERQNMSQIVDACQIEGEGNPVNRVAKAPHTCEPDNGGGQEYQETSRFLLDLGLSTDAKCEPSNEVDEVSKVSDANDESNRGVQTAIARDVSNISQDATLPQQDIPVGAVFRSTQSGGPRKEDNRVKEMFMTPKMDEKSNPQFLPGMDWPEEGFLEVEDEAESAREMGSLPEEKDDEAVLGRDENFQEDNCRASVAFSTSSANRFSFYTPSTQPIWMADKRPSLSTDHTNSRQMDSSPRESRMANNEANTVDLASSIDQRKNVVDDITVEETRNPDASKTSEIPHHFNRPQDSDFGNDVYSEKGPSIDSRSLCDTSIGTRSQSHVASTMTANYTADDEMDSYQSLSKETKNENSIGEDLSLENDNSTIMDESILTENQEGNSARKMDWFPFRCLCLSQKYEDACAD